MSDKIKLIMNRQRSQPFPVKKVTLGVQDIDIIYPKGCNVMEKV
jgi:hypothetical protein